MVEMGSTIPAQRKRWVPSRQEVIWMDCNPQAGREMRDVYPFLVLSPSVFNEKTSLVIGLPMTTSEYNSDNPFAVAVGKATGHKTGETSYVLCHQPISYDWRLRKARKHSFGALSDAHFLQVCERPNQMIQVG